MPRHLNYFQWLVYGAIAVQAAETFLSQKSWVEFGGFAVIAIVVGALAWTMAREKSRYATWVITIFFVADAINTVGMFWGGGPSWLQSIIAPEQPAITLVKLMDVATNLLEFAALYFYFFGESRTAPHQ